MNSKGVCDISFAEKARIFSRDYLKCCLYITTCDSPRHVFTKKLYSKLISTSQVLEDFLDFHGAKNSKSWFFYRELTAAVRHLCLGGYCQKHISNRLVFYCLPDNETFEAGGEKTLRFLTDCLVKLAPVILEEAEGLGIPIPEEGFDAADFPGITTSEMLPHDVVDSAQEEEEKKNIVKLANDFLSIVTHFDQIAFYEPYTFDQIRTKLVPDQINEVEIRQFEMLVHNLQSYFDTYVLHGGFSARNQKLKNFRSFFSVVFHLLQMMGRLLHFYERHLLDAGYKDIYREVRGRLIDLIDPEMLLDRTINYALYYVCHYLSTGKALAQEILNENIERAAITVGIPQKRGFHCRPSLLVAKIVQRYGGQVDLCVGEDRFDASSVLDIQWAGGKIQNEDIEIVIFEGDIRALKDIEILAAVNYGEDTMGKGIPLPRELKYLKEE